MFFFSLDFQLASILAFVEAELRKAQESHKKTNAILSEVRAQLRASTLEIYAILKIVDDSASKLLQVGDAIATKVKYFQEARMSERKLLSKLDDSWSNPDLKEILQSLLQRLCPDLRAM